MTTPNTPLIIQPLADSELSATRGSNTGGDALPYKVRYSNPRGSADPAGQVRMVSSRIASESSGSLSAAPVWDSGWLGAPTVTALPLGLRQFGVAEFNGRVYITGGKDNAGNILSSVYSAPLQGGSIGSWRAERPMVVWPLGPSASGATVGAPRYGHACCAATFGNSGAPGTVKGAGGTSWLICYSGDTPSGPDGALIAASIFGDGTLGPWQTISLTNSQLVFATLTPVPNQYSTVALVLGGGATVLWAAQQNWWVTPIRNAPANSPTWDTPVGWWGPQLPLLKMAGHNTRYDWAQGHLVTTRGADGTTSQQGEYSIALNIDTLNWSGITNGAGWLASTASGGVAQNQAGAIYFGCPQKGVATSYMYLFGGNSSALLPPPPANAVTTVSIGTYTWNASGDLASSSWTTSARSLPAAAYGLGAAVAAQLPISRSGWGPFTDNNFSRIYTLGGGNGSTAALSSTQSSTLPPIGNGSDLSAWTSGTGTGLAGGDLGTGGSIVADTASDAPAGAQLVTINHAAVTTPALSLSDGDQVVQTTYFIDKLGGDPSPAGYRTFAIGQAPSITNVSPANASLVTSGRPQISFSFSSGLGGGGEYAWQAVVTQSGNAVFDSGLRHDQQNTVALSAAPFLPPSQSSGTYTLTITVWSGDSSPTGAVISTVSTTTFGTSAFSAQSPVTGFTASPGLAWVNLNWTAPGGASYYRVYHRRTGSSNWILLIDNLAAHTFSAMDHIAVGVSYDYTVTAVSATPAESAQVAFQTVTIASGQFTHYLHVAGAGTGYGVALQVQGSPSVSLKQDAHSYLGFGQAAPVTRYGTGEYHAVSFEGLMLDATPATLAQLQAIMDAVQAGQVACLRDALGGQIVCTFDAEQAISIKAPFYRAPSLKLTEVTDTVGPYLGSGSAAGYPSFAAGRRLPLDPSERLL